MKYFRPLYAFLVGLIIILNSSAFSNLALINGLGQLVLFTLVVCIPIWRTGRMSYVDIGWPWGLVVLGIISFQYSDGYWLRSLVVSGVVVLIGLRMGLGALKMWRLGLLKKEFPRYQYQRIVWHKPRGVERRRFHNFRESQNSFTAVDAEIKGRKHRRCAVGQKPTDRESVNSVHDRSHRYTSHITQNDARHCQVGLTPRRTNTF